MPGITLGDRALRVTFHCRGGRGRKEDDAWGRQCALYLGPSHSNHYTVLKTAVSHRSNSSFTIGEQVTIEVWPGMESESGIGAGPAAVSISSHLISTSDHLNMIDLQVV